MERKTARHDCTNICGLARFHCWEEICRKVSGDAEKGRFLSLRFPWKLLTKSNRSCASWWIAYHHTLQWKDEMIPYSMAKHLIIIAVVGTEEDDETLVYVKKF